MAQNQTYSPYTPAQLKELNSQPAALPEGPFGPLYPGNTQQYRAQNPAVNSGYVKEPLGEEEAQAVETGSAAPYDPVKPAFTF